MLFGKVSIGVSTVIRVDIWSQSFPRKGENWCLDYLTRAGSAGRNETFVQLLSQTPNSWLVTSKNRLDNLCLLAHGIRERMLFLNQKGGGNKALRTKIWDGKRTSSSFTGDLQQSLSKWAVVIKTANSLVCEAAINKRLRRHMTVLYHMILLLMTYSTFRKHFIKQ